MSIDKLSDIEVGNNAYDDAMKHLSANAIDEPMQGKLANPDQVLNSYDELHTLNATGMGTELDGGGQPLPEVQDVSLHATVGTEHLDGLSGGEDGSIAANLHIIDLSGG